MNDNCVVMEDTPETMFDTISRQSNNQINAWIVEHLFSGVEVVRFVPGDPDSKCDHFCGSTQVNWMPSWIPICIGMRLTLTRQHT